MTFGKLRGHSLLRTILFESPTARRFPFPPLRTGSASRRWPRASRAPLRRAPAQRGQPRGLARSGRARAQQRRRFGPVCLTCLCTRGPCPAAGASPLLRAPRGDARPRSRRFEAPVTRASPHDSRRAARRRFRCLGTRAHPPGSSARAERSARVAALVRAHSLTLFQSASRLFNRAAPPRGLRGDSLSRPRALPRALSVPPDALRERAAAAARLLAAAQALCD